jgi:tetratricopeptide (TPR) repeat protein
LCSRFRRVHGRRGPCVWLDGCEATAPLPTDGIQRTSRVPLQAHDIFPLPFVYYHPLHLSAKPKPGVYWQDIHLHITWNISRYDTRLRILVNRQQQSSALPLQFRTMASTSTATLTSLLKATSITDHEEVLKAANAVLKTSKNNLDALHTRIVALLNLDRYHDALRAFDDGGDKLEERCRLEKAYAHYRVGEFAEAEELVASGRSRGLAHVAAQTAYKAERFEDAARIYEELSASEGPIEGEENDLRINGAATDAQLQWQGRGDKVEESRKKPSREDLEAFETSYNAACGCIARGDLNSASVLLKRARDLCEALEDMSDEAKQEEVLPIMVQQAYVFTKLGKIEEAEAIQRMINIAKYEIFYFSF